MRLSIVIPAYNEEKRIRKTLTDIIAYCRKRNIVYEIIVVDDGSADSTASVARNAATQSKAPVRVIRGSGNEGKGSAVKKGILAAKMPYVLFCDADHSTPIHTLDVFSQYLKYDIVVGSRNLPESKITKPQPFLRSSMGKLFPLLVRMLAVKGIKDTQCGFKLFKTAIAKKLVKQQRLHGWAFDVELLYLAQKHGYSIKEVPVSWRNDPNSKVRILRDPMKMMLDLLRIRWNDVMGRYGK